MSFVVKSKVTQKADGSELYIEVYNATGLYNASLNPPNLTGFGTPNPARNTLALVFYGNHKRVAEDVLAVPLAHDPITVQSYTLPLPGKNGVLNYFVFAVPIYNPAGSYVDGNITYNNQNASDIFIQKRVAGVWTRVTSDSLIGDTSIVQLEDFAFPIPEMGRYRNQLNIARLAKLQNLVHEQCEEEDYEAIRNSYDYVDSELHAACLDFNSAAYSEAQFKIETLETYAVQHPVV